MELVAGRGVAAKVEADLAGPVIVAGPRTYEPELTGDLSQPCPVLAVVVVVVDLDSVESNVRECSDPRPGQDTLAPTRPWMRQNGLAASILDEADRLLEVGSVAIDVRRFARHEVALEGFVTIGDDSKLDQRIGDMGSTHRRGIDGVPAYVIGVDVDTEPAQPFERRGQT